MRPRSKRANTPESKAVASGGVGREPRVDWKMVHGSFKRLSERTIKNQAQEIKRLRSESRALHARVLELEVALEKTSIFLDNLLASQSTEILAVRGAK